ncbi:zinc-dependent metalloprotease [Spirulina subsalsa]|uniref:zinc-dependent metalloprotease n=1 Tax=Spirulina subsalsa TaxID=54311 RepID=UPI0002E4403C|nr:zinc-dependent metalloprotease [Spirulina subsalsa]
MKRIRFWFGLTLWFLVGLLMVFFLVPLPLQAQLSPPWPIARTQSQSFEDLVQGKREKEGLFRLYYGAGKLYLEIQPEQLNRDYLLITSLASGIGEDRLVTGFPIRSFLFRFRRVNNQIQFVLPNLSFRVSQDPAVERSVQQSFSDSVLQVLPVAATHPTRNSILVDFTRLLLSQDDVSGLANSLGANYSIDSDKSYLNKVRAFPENIELNVVYGFSSGSRGPLPIPSIPDPRSFNLGVHYSISQLPQDNRYVPRLADDRVGYFINTYQDVGDTRSRDPVVRYIRRWRLEPQDPLALSSRPVKPIVFWLENTIPMEYREAVRDGVLAWNKAFERAGFQEAIVVKQMPDDATWDPADVRYNTVRWSSTSSSGILGIGPSQMNPLTGEILAADVVINGNVLRYLQDQFQNLPGLHQGLEDSLFTEDWCRQGLGFQQYWGQSTEGWSEQGEPQKVSPLEHLMTDYDLCYGFGALEQANMGMVGMTLLGDVIPRQAAREQYINQFLRFLVAHEIGHALGLRHNFHGSTLLRPEELNNTEVTHDKGLVSSMMDYVGVNLAPPGTPQGDFFPVVVGPYDGWAIEYGYKYSGALVSGAERQFLDEIASESSRPEFAYATDEDLFGFQDPNVNAFDLSGDVLRFAQWQLENSRRMWQQLERRYPVAGDRYSDMRARFNQIFSYYSRQVSFISNFIGGRSFNRDRPGRPNSRLPFQQVSLQQQREALNLLQKYLFSTEGFSFSPGLLNQLAPSRWPGVGQPVPLLNLDYPIHDNILALQGRILRSLLSPQRLSRLRDQELKSPQEALSLPELYDTLQAGIWSEVLDAQRSGVNISSLRRSLQREHLQILGAMVLGRSPVPEDARTLAWYELRQLQGAINRVLGRFGGQLDAYTRAHLSETGDRITGLLSATFERVSVDL